MRVPNAEIGRLAASYLLARLAGDVPSPGSSPRSRLRPTLFHSAPRLKKYSSPNT